MTTLSRKLRRVVPLHGRDLVLILHPGNVPLIEIREKGRRSGFAAPISSLYQILAQRAADGIVAARRAARIAKRRERMAS